MDRVCQWCGRDLPEPTVRLSGKRQRFCQRKCQRAAYGANVNKVIIRRHRGEPMTSDRLYDDEELIWLKAVDRWRRDHDGRTPNCREVLGIARELGYSKSPGGARVGDARRTPACRIGIQATGPPGPTSLAKGR